MKWDNIFLIVLSIIQLGLGVYIYFRNPRHEINISYSLFILSVLSWIIGIAVFRSTANISTAFIWAKLYYVSATLTAPTFLCFTFVFPYKKILLKLIHKILIILPSIIIIVFLLFTKLLIIKVVSRSWGNEVLLSPNYYLFVIYFLIFIIWSFYNLFNKYKISDGIHRWQLRWLIAGTLTSFVLGIIFDLILPWAGNYQLIWYGPAFSVIWMGFMSYILFKKNVGERR